MIVKIGGTELRITEMTHFTLTGMYAGQVICGKAKDAADNYVHFGSLYGRPNPTDLCTECEQIINGLGNEDE